MTRNILGDFTAKNDSYLVYICNSKNEYMSNNYQLLFIRKR